MERRPPSLPNSLLIKHSLETPQYLAQNPYPGGTSNHTQIQCPYSQYPAPYPKYFFLRSNSLRRKDRSNAVTTIQDKSSLPFSPSAYASPFSPIPSPAPSPQSLSPTFCRCYEKEYIYIFFIYILYLYIIYIYIFLPTFRRSYISNVLQELSPTFRRYYISDVSLEL